MQKKKKKKNDVDRIRQNPIQEKEEVDGRGDKLLAMLSLQIQNAKLCQV